jgi:diguanylate cyclase (GGDEF)-like protein
MPRAEVIKFFLREAGKAYDPEVVRAFVDNLESLESLGRELAISQDDVWAVPEVLIQSNPVNRRLESFHPLITYSKAIGNDAETERSLRAVVDFSRSDLQGVLRNDVLIVMGNRLSELATFDAAVFYIANLQNGTVVAEHVVGDGGGALRNLTLSLEHKLSGWAAANNQALCNLPCFPDFIRNPDLGASFQICCVAPMNREGFVLGAISLYRRDSVKFGDDEFRRLELVASKTAIALSKCQTAIGYQGLFDDLTGLPNAQQLHLMFDQVMLDASKGKYGLALFVIRLNPVSLLPVEGNGVSAVATYLENQLRDTDVLVRYARDEFVLVMPRADPQQAEEQKARFRYDLNHLQFDARSRVDVGSAFFPQEGTDLETLLSAAVWGMSPLAACEREIGANRPVRPL